MNETDEISDDVSSKLRLIIRRAQSGKTYICITDIKLLPGDLHIVLTMNTIKSSKQFLGRVIKIMGAKNIIIYNSDKSSASKDLGCHHCHDSSEVTKVMRDNKDIKVIIMCSHPKRWFKSLDEIVDHLEDSRKFGNRKVTLHSDEAHAYIPNSKIREKVEKLLESRIIRSFRMYSASPFPIWGEGIWKDLYIINVNHMYNIKKNDMYFGVSDCDFVPIRILDSDINYNCTEVSPKIVSLSKYTGKNLKWCGKDTKFDWGNEIKYLQYIKSILPKLKLLPNDFSYNFIPSYTRKITQYEIMTLILEEYPTSNVIIMNGNDSGMTLFRNKYKKYDSNSTILEPSEQILDLLKSNKCSSYPTFIIGFHTCNMSVTLISEDIGNFDNMVFYHEHLKGDPELLYQMMRIVFSYRNWDEYELHKIKNTKIYGNEEVHKLICDYEKTICSIENLEEGEYNRREVSGDVPIREKKKEKKINHLESIPEEYIDADIESYHITFENEERKWKQIEEDYFEFTGKKLGKQSDPRNKKENNFILTGAMGNKYKNKHVTKTELEKWLETLKWCSNFSIEDKKYKYCRLYVGYKNINDTKKYTVYMRTVELTENDEVDKHLLAYKNSDK